MRKFVRAAATAALATVAMAVPMTATASAAPSHSASGHYRTAGHGNWGGDHGRCGPRLWGYGRWDDRWDRGRGHGRGYGFAHQRYDRFGFGRSWLDRDCDCRYRY
ncbi:hypothetical protein ACFYWP_39615 [Actinacidiphila glaucinigra]|uniref:hypothetical protein n=1 Tax=Actinacidiphila glaucinigra TaxID=235986 RepID=UPI0036C44C85